MSKLEHAIFGTMTPSELSDMPYGWNAEEIAQGTTYDDLYQLIRIWPDDEGREGGYCYAILAADEEYDDQDDWGKPEDAIRAGEEMGIRWDIWAPEINAAMDAARKYRHSRKALESQITSRIDYAEMSWNNHLQEENRGRRFIQLKSYERSIKWAKQMIALYEEEYGEWTGPQPQEHDIN